MNINLSGKTALIGGSSQGIGAAVAQALAELDANVILLARNEDKLKTLAASLPGSGKKFWIACDVSDRVKLEKQISAGLKSNGPIHILVNNSGGPAAGPALDATEEQFLQAFQNHVLVNAMLAKLLLPGMKEAGYGRIINIISTSVKIPIDNLGVSNTIRAAVANWAKTLANELGPFGITVNNVLPGFTDTERLTVLRDNQAKRIGKTPEEVSDTWKNSIPMKRLGQPAEIAAAAAFLASPAASYISGINLPVDGGRTGCL